MCFPGPTTAAKKPRSRGFFASLFCCFGTQSTQPSTQPAGDDAQNGGPKVGIQVTLTFVLFNLVRMSHAGIFLINIPVTNTRTILLIYFVLVLYYLTHVCNRTYFFFFSKFLKRLTNFTMYHDIIKKT